MKIYVINREHLNSKLKRFYESRYEKLKKENKVLRKDDIMKHFRDMVKFINADVVDETLNQPVFDEWIDKGYKQFKHKKWFFAVDYIQIQDGEGRWVTVDCHHESKNHNDTLLEKMLRRMKELIKY